MKNAPRTSLWLLIGNCTPPRDVVVFDSSAAWWLKHFADEEALLSRKRQHFNYNWDNGSRRGFRR